MAKRNWHADVQKVAFVIEAAVERRKALLAGDLTLHREEPFQDIDEPVLGTVSIGRLAMAKLEELSVSALAFAGLSGRVAIHTARQSLGPLLIRLIIRDGQPISRATLEQAFYLSGEEMRPVLKTRTYLLPCHIVDGEEPESIMIGPVTFLNRSAARTLIRDAIRTHVTDRPTWERGVRRLLVQAIKYYRKYQWVALVEIVNCDPALAGEYARSTITLALSGLQLFLGTKASQSMAVGGDPLGWARTAEIRFTPEGVPDVSVTVSYRGGEYYEDGWSQDLERPGMLLGMRLLGMALEANLPGRDRPLSSRYLGSLQWFGEAVRERSPAIRFIKFMTAIEHLLLTGERNGITWQLAQRVAALTYDIGSAESRISVENEFRRLYNLRSKIVHGALPPWDESATLELGAVAELAEKVLHSALNCWREKGLMSTDTNPKRMRVWFEETVWMMIQATEPVDHITCWGQWLGQQR